MTKLVLYAARPESVPVIRCSPPSFAALIALLEEGVDHELRWIRFDAGEHKTPEMLRLSPAGTVPILVDGDDVVTDTVEILERIARHSGHLTDPSAMDDARALKDAGMRALVSLMKGAPDWTSVEPVLDAWQARLGRAAARRGA
jgi:glutathione S-transferase